MPTTPTAYDTQNQAWKITGLVILCIRFVQGWIFWGGGSRRFIYAPQKLDPYAHDWMANKFQSAMPGAILGVEHIINFMLQHFYLLYTSIILFSLIELFSGLALMLGLFTRFAALATTLLSIVLMLTFGWQGATCMDEWTMAAATLAMGFTLVLSGAPIYSLDSLLLHHSPSLRKKWFAYIASGQLPYKTLHRISIVCLIFTIAFTIGTYNYYRGAVWSWYHAGPVSPRQHHITLTDGKLKADGSVAFTAYVDAGTPALPSNIIRIELVNAKGEAVEVWEGKELSNLAKNKINNVYRYNQFVTGQYGLIAPMSAKAKIELPSVTKNLNLKDDYQLQVYTINGNKFILEVR